MDNKVLMDGKSGLYDPVRNICGNKDSWRIKIRTIHMWNVYSINQLVNQFAIQLILMNAKVLRLIFILNFFRFLFMLI